MSGRDMRAYALDAPSDEAGGPAASLCRARRALLGPVAQRPDQSGAGRSGAAARGLPAALLARSFAELAIPLTVVATDYYERIDVGFSEGPLLPAVAASMAIPGALRPVRHQGRVLIDGGTINPVPVDRVRTQVTLAVDVLNGAGGVHEINDVIPDPWDALFGSVTLMMQVLSAARLEAHRPTIHLRPPVEDVRVLDFFRVKEIFATCEPIKEQVKRRLDIVLGSSPAVLLDTPASGA